MKAVNASDSEANRVTETEAEAAAVERESGADWQWEECAIEEAVASWTAALRQRPSLVDIRLNLARAMCLMGRWQEAAHEYGICLPFHPEDGNLLMRLAICYKHLGDVTYARMLLEQALRLEPGHHLARAIYAHMAPESRPGAEGFQRLLVWEEAARVGESNGNQVDATFTLACGAVERGDRREARQMLEDLVLADPGDAPSLCLLAQLEEEDGRLPWAMFYYERAIAVAPQYWEPHYNLARLRAAEEDDGAAIPLLERALLLNAECGDAAWLLGQVHLRAASEQDAVYWLRRALELQPGNAAVANELGHLAIRRGDFDDARFCFERAHQLRPDDGTAYHLGLCRYRDGDMEGARSLWERSGCNDARRARAALAFETGDLDQCARLAGNDFDLHFLVGNAFLDGGSGVKAAWHFARCTEIAPESRDAWVNLGVADPARAAEAWRRAVALDPWLAVSYF